jgi:hypothetical protein
MRTVATALIFLLMLLPARALPESDRAAIRSVIESQLQAFSADDGARAYSFAAPSIRRLFPSEERFMSMVRDGYKPVYRRRAYTFGELKEDAGEVAQSVLIQDADGEEWLAVYTMERQPDGTWRISGCFLLRNPGQAA